MNSRRLIACPASRKKASYRVYISVTAVLAVKRHLYVRFGQKQTCAVQWACPLYPRKRTCAVQLGDVPFAKSELVQRSKFSSTSPANASGFAGVHSEAAVVPYLSLDQLSFEHIHTRYAHCECHTAEALAKSFGQTVTNSFSNEREATSRNANGGGRYPLHNCSSSNVCGI